MYFLNYYNSLFIVYIYNIYIDKSKKKKKKKKKKKERKKERNKKR